MAQATPLTQEDLDIYALIANALEQPLPEPEAGLVDTEALGENVVDTKAPPLSKRRGRKNKKIAAREAKQKRSKELKVQQHRSTGKRTSQPEGGGSGGEKHLEPEQSRSTAESPEGKKTGNGTHPRPQIRSQPRPEASNPQTDTSAQDRSEHHNLRTHAPHTAKKRNKRRRRERYQKASRLQAATPQDEAGQAESLIIGNARFQHLTPVGDPQVTAEGGEADPDSRTEKNPRHELDSPQTATFTELTPKQHTQETPNLPTSKRRSKRHHRGQCRQRQLQASAPHTDRLQAEAEPSEALKFGPNFPYHPLPPPVPLSPLSLSSRITLTRVRRRISNLQLQEPKYRRSQFLVRNPGWKDHPFYCSDEMLAEVWGFVDPELERGRQSERGRFLAAGLEGGWGVEGQEECGADDGEGGEREGVLNGFARRVMELCELQEVLAGYEIRCSGGEGEGGRDLGVESRPVSPKTVGRGVAE